MDSVKYIVKYLNGDIIIKVFVNGKLDRADKMPEKHKITLIEDCGKFNMTIEEGVIFLTKKMNRIQKAFDQQDRELEIMSTHNHRHH